LNFFVFFTFKVVFVDLSISFLELSSLTANFAVYLEITESGTSNISVLDKLSVSELNHLFKALESKLTHRIQVILVLASSHRFDVSLNVVERFQSFSHLPLSLVRLSTAALEPHGLDFMDTSLVSTSLEEDIHGVLSLIN